MIDESDPCSMWTTGVVCDKQEPANEGFCMKRRAARQAKMREEWKAEREAKQDLVTNSTLRANPKQS